jgi:glyoxylase-like metal-dependent hydrolase (beta-lactamase superfamily II)
VLDRVNGSGAAWGNGMTTRLHEVATGVWVATSRRYATTSTVLLDGHGGAVVIDPAWDPDELAAIPADLIELGVRCVAGVATHEHYDHVRWHPDLGPVPRWATAGTVGHLARERDALLAPLAEYLTADLIEIAGRLEVLPGELLPWDGPSARCIVHDAHAPAHLALLVEESGVLVAGDMLSDLELPMPAAEDTTLERYATGLELLRGAVLQARLVVPGHGTPTTDVAARFDADRRYLDDLISGRVSDDARIDDPENAGLHAANLERARLTR